MHFAQVFLQLAYRYEVKRDKKKKSDKKAKDDIKKEWL